MAAIAYPLGLPAAPGFRSSRFTPHDVIAISTSPFTGEQQAYAHQGQWWTADLELPRMKRSAAEAWLTFFLKLRGVYGTFLFGDPDGRTPRGVATGTPVVAGSGQTGDELVTGGWTPSTAGILLAGDYIQLGSGATARLYKVLDDVASDGAGLATLRLWPRLRSSPTDGAAIVVSNARGVFRLAANVPWDSDHVSTYGLTFGCIEVL